MEAGSPEPFGHYELLELLGRGGMGEVYRAHDTKTDRIVAIKLLPPHLAADTAFQRRFRREARAAAGVNDPHVVPIHGYGEIDGRLYLDMRLIEGRNLGAILAAREADNEPPLGVAAAAVVVEQVASALDAAHQQGLVHRDVKPSNILITDRDFVYLIDFGLARTTSEPGMTTAGNTLGTLAYMAPERFGSGASDTRSDIYALTCVLYECLTGSRPFPSDSLEQQIAGHMVAPPPRPSDTDPTLAAFDPVIAKGMAKDPEKRYQTGAELAAAVRRAVDSPRVRPSRRSRRSAHRALAEPGRRTLHRMLLLTGLGAVLVVVFAFGAWQMRSASDVKSGLPSDNSPDSSGAVPAIAATVPADIRSSGKMIIGINLPYAPNEFRDAYGELVGFDIDLMDAVARTLGLTPEYREVAFDDIIPAVQRGTYTLGVSSITDTKDREQLVDFVTYFDSGVLWAQRTGAAVNPDDACGLRVGVAAGGLPDAEEIPAKNQRCLSAGRPPIEKVVYQRQDELNSGLIAGEVDAMSADSPVTGFAIKTSGGALEAAGETFDTAPYGWPVAKGSPMAESLRQALEYLIKTGEYRTIARLWGVDRGAVDKPVINGAVR